MNHAGHENVQDSVSLKEEKKGSFFKKVKAFLKIKEVDKPKELVIYSSRKEHLIRPVIEEYEKAYGSWSETRVRPLRLSKEKKGQSKEKKDEEKKDEEKKDKGKKKKRNKIKITYLTGEAQALIQKIKIEKKLSKADLLITVDAGSLGYAKKEGLFLNLNSKILNQNIPSHWRDKDGAWYGLSLRARPIFYNPKKVKESELSTYEDLASSRWKNKLCLRTSRKVYTQFLVASMLVHLGERKTEKILRSWVRNLATKVFFSDVKLLKAIASEQCFVGVANVYYYARLLRDNPQLPLKIFWPNQKGRGAHLNISGVGVLKTSKRKKEAQKFIEWLSGKKAQKIFSDLNMEYPIHSKVKPHSLVQSFGHFKRDRVSLSRIGEGQQKAILLMDKVGYE